MPKGRRAITEPAWLRLLWRPAVGQLLPPSLRDDRSVEALHGRVIGVLMVVFALLSGAFALFDLATGLLWLALPLLVGTLGSVAVLWALRAGVDHRRAATAACALLTVVVLGNAAFNGGLFATSLIFLAIVPSVAIALDARATPVWALLVLATLVGIWGLHGVGLRFWQTMPAEMLPLNHVLVLVALLAATTVVSQLQEARARWLQERLLEVEGRRTERILDTAGEALLGTDRDGRIRFANGAATELFGAPDLLGTRLSDYLPERPAPDGHAVRIELVLGGDRRAVEVQGAPIDDDEDVWVVRDVERWVVAQRELEQARDAASAASTSKSQFLASMSHELRTPLNAVIGYAELMLDDLDAGEPVATPDDLERIVGSARHLLALIDQVLDLAKIEAGKLQLEWREVPLQGVIDELATTGAALARARGNRFRCAVDAPAGLVLTTDELRLKQVMLNLLGNAAKFTEEGEIRLDVAVHGDELVVAVADTGIGMTAEQQARVWRAFEQAEQSTTRRFGGSGLGLSLSRQLAGALGGRLTMRSEHKRGSTFTLSVPCVPAHDFAASPTPLQ